MTEIMPFPENNFILFYWTAPSRRPLFAFPSGVSPGRGSDTPLECHSRLRLRFAYPRGEGFPFVKMGTKKRSQSSGIVNYFS